LRAMTVVPPVGSSSINSKMGLLIVGVPQCGLKVPQNIALSGIQERGI
jgi:hypothetical protein